MDAEVDVFRDVEMAMRDGVVLRADLYLPNSQDAPLPTLIVRTPYGKNGEDTALADYGALAARGYAVLVQDKRGRNASDGEFSLLRDHSIGPRQDGFDTVEWVARQPWSDGFMGTFGLSYLGETALGAAVAAPEHLRAVVAIQPATDEFTDRTFHDGVFHLAASARWATYDRVAGDVIARMPEPDRTLAQAELEEFRAAGPDQLEKLPLSEWPFLRRVPTLWGDALSHRDDPYFFFESRIGVPEAKRIRVPILHIGGWYDFFARNTVRQFELAKTHSAAGASQRLVVGPWSHGALRASDVAGTGFPDAGIAENEAILAWMDQWLRGADPAVESEALIYVQGADRWRSEPVWPIVGTETRSLYLDSISGASFTAPEVGSRSFRYDPRHPYRAPSVGHGPADVTAYLHAADVLTYSTEPMTEELEITGWPRAVLFGETTGTDADWLVELHVVGADGTMRMIDEGIARGSYRNGREHPRAVPAGETVEYTVELRPISLLVKPGERLRVVVAGGKFPVFERNPGVFTDLASLTTDDFVVTTQTVHSGPGRSRVELPIVPAAARGEWVDNPWPAAPVTPTAVRERQARELPAQR